MDPAFSFAEPNLLKRQMFQAFRDVLEITEDESDHASDEALKALKAFEDDVQYKGKAILDQVEAENRVAILVIGRPYHSDPGLNHGIPDEFQVLGYPILSIRSIPKDDQWLKRFFKEDLEAGRIRSMLDINDVWPENYSANSAMKVWAAKFAARHPNVVLLDLSSFKCGHDAPTYGIIDSIVQKSAVPYSALHDIDANKPGGSIKIRVKTYAHTLMLHQEKLEDMANKKRQLQQRLDEKRLELLQMKHAQMQALRNPDAKLSAEIEALTEKVRGYELDRESMAQQARADAQKGLVMLKKKTAAGDMVAVQ
jgi:predicted nucleotide-binding protein (sugar kinase/HSP70/actin superfamily)